MNILVLAKHAFVNIRPTIATDGKGFEPEALGSEMNDWDRYAVEEAVQIKEQRGAEVTAVSVGTGCDHTLRTCLAMGVDRAIKIPFDSVDSWQVAEAIREVVKSEKFDLILTGFQSQDLNNALVGPLLARMLGLPYATAVTSVTFEDDSVSVMRELEGGFQEEDRLPFPCLLTVQTGINIPRYPSLRSIMKAKSREITEVPINSGSPTFEIEKIYFPTVKKGKMVTGSPEEVSSKLIEILKERKVL